MNRYLFIVSWAVAATLCLIQNLAVAEAGLRLKVHMYFSLPFAPLMIAAYLFRWRRASSCVLVVCCLLLVLPTWLLLLGSRDFVGGMVVRAACLLNWFLMGGGVLIGGVLHIVVFRWQFNPAVKPPSSTGSFFDSDSTDAAVNE